jgi:hypothetical protein
MSASLLVWPYQFTVGNEDVNIVDEPIQSSIPEGVIASAVLSKGKRSITEEHWKWLQPIVSRLYIEEDLTFLQIQIKLKSDYDFYLS